MRDVVLASPGIPGEAELVTSAPRAGLRVLRRCVDAADLLAACAADDRPLAVVSAALPRLGADVVSRLGGGVVGLAADPADAEALRRMGVGALVDASAGTAPDEVWRRVLRRPAAPAAPEDPGQGAPGVWPVEATPPEVGDLRSTGVRAGHGLLVAVWGPAGAPGRTTVAIGLGEALADAGHRSCVVDADTYAPSVALAVGLPDAVGGLLRACRRADGGVLDAETLASAARAVRGRLHVLGGLPASDHWPELRGPALDRVWSACRGAFDVTVVDVGFCLEQDEGPAAFGARRNGAALSALAHADQVLAVADGSGAGAARLVAAWPALGQAAPGPVTVVCNRRAVRDWEEAVAALGVGAPVHRVPADARALAACWARGRTLREGARRSALRRSWSALAESVVRR